MRVMEALGLGEIKFNDNSAQPTIEQFWEQFDGYYDLTEESMREELDVFITDPSNRAAVDALLEGRNSAAELSA